MQRLVLPSAPMPTYLGGAALLAALAYPLRSEADERARTHGLLCAAALRLTTPETAPFDLRAVSPFHAALADQGVLSLGHMLNRIKKRDKTGAIAAAAIWQSMHGKLDRMPEGMVRASMANAFSKATALNWFGNDDRNFRGRTWGPSLPVMHLICSFHFAMWRASEEGRVITLEDILLNRALQRAVVAGSSVFLPHVVQCWPTIKTDELWLFEAPNLDHRQVAFASANL